MSWVSLGGLVVQRDSTDVLRTRDNDIVASGDVAWVHTEAAEYKTPEDAPSLRQTFSVPAANRRRNTSVPDSHRRLLAGKRPRSSHSTNLTRRLSRITKQINFRIVTVDKVSLSFHFHLVSVHHPFILNPLLISVVTVSLDPFLFTFSRAICII